MITREELSELLDWKEARDEQRAVAIIAAMFIPRMIKLRAEWTDDGITKLAIAAARKLLESVREDG